MGQLATECPISVVIPIFNRQALGMRAVLSACAQAIAGMEVLVIDDGSQPAFQIPTIDSPDVTVRLIRLSANSGASAARNLGIAEARSEWIALLDSDDYWLAGTLEPRLQAAKLIEATSEGQIIAHAAGFIIKKRKNDWRDIRIPASAKNPDEFVCGCWFAPGSTLLLRKEVFERVGPFDVGLMRLEDYDWFLRFALAGGHLEVWDRVAAITEVEAKVAMPVLESSAERLLAKYATPGSPPLLSAQMMRHLRAYLNLERASISWYCGQPAKTLFYLVQSFLLFPRLTMHLKSFWSRLQASEGASDVRLRDAIALNQARCSTSREAVEVLTDPRSGGYSAVLPLMPSRHRGPMRFRCFFEVVEGSIGISAVTADCTMLAERIAARPGPYELDIVVPRAQDAAGILVRNYAMTGRPSRARVGLILAEPYPTEKLPVIKPAGQSRNLQIPLRFYEVRDHPSETGELVTSQIALDPAVTVAIVIDAWETLGERIGSNISDKLAPALLALRAAGIRIAHLPHDRPIHPLARPLEEETVIPGELMDTDMFADMLRNARVKHLIYLGYFSNQCVLRRSLGMLEMRKRGFETTLVRDASAARETPESLEGEWHHRAAIHFIEINGGTTTTTAELQAAVAAMAAT